MEQAGRVRWSQASTGVRSRPASPEPAQASISMRQLPGRCSLGAVVLRAHLCSPCLEVGYREKHGRCTADGAPGILDPSVVDLDEENNFYCHRSTRFVVREQSDHVLEPTEVFEIRYYTCFTDLHCRRRAPARRRVVLYHILPSSESVRMCQFEMDSLQ
ncbi:uncharacterized protein LOC123446818 [Hordeum vulgare subsp. vulgare]|uniref:uncharacterized protein LOC123446818 n=1 Tax=Hordeum vulgare subsp. vulgare TaxID=112509 RepID=UPI000B471C21|nr:uncharacterized protein LOC123446818 [Hordeum vulgare subsp. vulgare]